MSTPSLATVAKALVAPGKGILAADESIGTANKRFDPLGIAQTVEMRRAYREMLFTAPGAGDYFSGVILYDETIRQARKDGVSFVESLKAVGVLPGIKVDTGTVPLPFAPGEKITEGLDGLQKRVAEYVKLGAAFAKWRAVIEISKAGAQPVTPTWRGLLANAHALARYAAICQEGGLVPIVEPEVLMDGDHDHTIERSFEVHELTLRVVFAQLAELGVQLEGMLLKPSMVAPGQKSAQKASVGEIAAATVEVLLRTVPPAVAGIAFLSGGQNEEEATETLNEINRIAAGRAPWPLTFSYGRALQAPALRTWNGQDANVPAAQAALAKRARLNALAAAGHYEEVYEQEPPPRVLAGSPGG
jgi:fructose-bisphosphate aldolase class I